VREGGDVSDDYEDDDLDGLSSHDIIYAGVDPGSQGALAYINAAGDLLDVIDLPLSADRSIDVQALSGLFTDEMFVCVEKVSFDPKWSRSSIWKLCENFASIKTVVRLSGAKLILPTPQTWKGRILKGTKRDKVASVTYAKDRYPGFDLDRHDRAEAVLLAEYARLTRSADA
jgi:hypothetical protein